MTFYSNDSDKWYFGTTWEVEREELKDFNVSLLTVEEANTHSIDDLIIKECSSNSSIKLTKPRIIDSYHYFCIPYELGEEIENGLEPETIISNLVNDNINSPIFIASTDSELCCFGKSDFIDEEIIWGFSSQHINTPFIIFSDEKKFFALIDYDLPLQIIGYKKTIIDSNNYIKNNVGQIGWNNIFEKYARYPNMPYIFKEYYNFLLPKDVAKILNSLVIPSPNKPFS